MNARKNGLTECMLLRMQGSGMGLEDVSRILSEKLREHDYVGQLKDGGICILLSNLYHLIFMVKKTNITILVI